MAISSINFAKAKLHSLAHNLREDEPSYLLSKEFRLPNETWQHELPEHELFARSACLQKTGKKPLLENSRWEAVLNLNAKHTLADVQVVAKHIEKEFGIVCSSIAIHRDEGRLKNGKPIYNLHAHLNFITHQNGRQNWRKEFVKPDKLSKLQTRVSELLNMQRGDPNKKAQRLEHREYKKVAKERESLEADLQKERQEHEKTLQKLLKTQKEAREYQTLAQELKIENKALKIENKALKEELELLKKMYDEDRAKLKASGQATQKDYQELKRAKDELEAELRSIKIDTALKEFQKKEVETLRMQSM